MRPIRRALLGLALLLALAVTPAAAQEPAAWLRTVVETALWSGATDPAERFTVLPVDSYVVAQAPAQRSDGARMLVYYPGDGLSRQAGLAWIATDAVTPSDPPDWVSESEPDVLRPADAATPLHRTAYITPPAVSAPEVAVLDGASGLMLYGRQAHTRQAPASTTKIVTALVALEHIDSLDRTVPITVDGWAMALADGSSIMGLSPGQRLSLRTLLFGLLLPSGNDAAEQLARTVAESRAQFVEWMNDAVVSAGLNDTHFVNPSGLDASNHYASAYDLAVLARVAMGDDVFASIVASPAYLGDGFRLVGHNPLLGAYPGADGVKTGTTDAAGHVIVGSAVRDGHRVFVVAMHSQDLLGDCSALLDWVWQSFAW
jgi:D-alanyl-D-alanine carboxypeptidase